MSALRVGPGSVPSRESPEQAVELLVKAGYDACEIDLSDGFWMDRDFASRFGELAAEGGIVLSIHAPLAAFLGHVEAGGRQPQMAGRMLYHSAGHSVAF